MVLRALAFARSRTDTLLKSSSLKSFGSRSNETFFQRNPLLRQQPRWISILASSSIDNDSDRRGYPLLSLPLYQHQQVRWKRRGGASAFTKPRPVSRKKLKAFNRRKKELHYQKYGRHSPPGSKAKLRREFAEDRWDSLLNHDPKDTGFGEPKQIEYDLADALVDDLIGNTSHLTSTPTPEPTYLGHLHKRFYNRVADQLEQHRQHQQQLLTSGNSSSDNVESLPTQVKLPTDNDISLVLRAYRDRHGTRNKPIGIAKALQHLLQDLKLPASCFGELTYTTLLTCCRTPKEARRIFKLQRDSHQPISAYSWSILVDIHAKLGDYEGCNRVMQEMASEGVEPTLAAYTSLLAACYKVCNAGGRVPSSVRAEAGKLGWSKWKELRIIGLEPDVMAYGAMLRICAARGHPERAVGLLEEMQAMDVKPTTLCFTSALRAVARSHQTAVRYERAFSKKNRRREHVTAHHGKMTRSILILAENAHVDQDDGFVAALMLCTAAAGDSATAKAVLLASEVRRMDRLRTIGSDNHLKELRGEKKLEINESFSPGHDHLPDGLDEAGVAVLDGTSSPALRQKARPSYPSFGDREYGGKDTRPLSALLLACSQAAENRGLGDIWAGRENKGYLCDNSLRLITVRSAPTYVDDRIPGMSYQDVARGALVWDEDEEPEQMGKRLRRAKFRGVDIDPDAGFTLDELDDQLYDMFANDDDEGDDDKGGGSSGDDETVDAQELVKGQEGKMEPHRTDWIEGTTSTASFDAATGTYHIGDTEDEEPGTSFEPEPPDDEEWSFDSNAREWKTRMKAGASLVLPEDSRPPSNEFEAGERHLDEEEYFFDRTLNKWRTRSGATFRAAGNDAAEKLGERSNNVDGEEFEQFFEGLKEEVLKSGEDIEVLEEEARAFFEDAKTKESVNTEAMSQDKIGDDPNAEIDSKEFDLFFDGLKEQVKESEDSITVSEADARELFTLMKDEFNVENEALSPSGNDQFSNESTPPTLSSSDSDDSEFEDFFESLKEEAKEAGEEDGVEEADAREFCNMMKSEFDTDDVQELSSSERNISSDDLSPASSSSDFDSFLSDLKDEWRAEGINVDDDDDTDQRERFEVPRQIDSPQDIGSMQSSVVEFDDHLQPPCQILEEGPDLAVAETHPARDIVDLQVSKASSSPSKVVEPTVVENSITTEENMAEKFVSTRDLRFADMDKELEEMLPGLPQSRIRKIRNVFFKSLGDPSMLRLVPLLRENMPDYVTPGWLKRKNLQNAVFVMKKANQDDLIDLHMLNGMLQVETSCGSLDRALTFHQEKFKRHNVQPNAYSDRLVLQMLVKNNRLPRALAFKQTIEESGRTLDIQSYGSIMEHYGKKGQLGSALLVLKECIAVHGAPPGEKSLKKIRLLCRQHDVEKEVVIVDMIGKNPVEWIRHGEQNLKREYSYRGRRNVLLPRNRMVQI